MRKNSPASVLIKLACLLMVAGILAWAIIIKPPTRKDDAAKPGIRPQVFDPLFVRLMPEEVARLPIATRFDYPMGSEHAALTYNARPFREVGHLGDDFNGIGGTDSDLGDAIYAIGAGEVVYLGTPSAGWGTVAILAHRVPVDLAPGGGGGDGGNESTADLRVIQSVYAHLADIRLYVGQVVRRGDRIGSVGPTALGSNWPHLHFEIRESRVIAPGVGYADTQLDRLNPEEFLAAHRGAPDDLLNSPPRQKWEEREVHLKGAVPQLQE